MTEPVIAQKAPYEKAVTEGESYWWCTCGLSKKQPLCDGSHKGTGMSPLEYTAKRTKNIFFCGCKRSANPPLCDGAHKAL